MLHDIPSALKSLAPGAEWAIRGNEILWHNGHGYEQPTDAEISAKINELNSGEAMRLLRIERDKRLAKDDWKVVRAKETGTNLSADFKSYRQALRDLPSTATPTLDSNYQLDMSSVTWPTEP